MRQHMKSLFVLAALAALLAGCSNAASSSSSQPSEPQVSLELPSSSSSEPAVPEVTMEKVAQANTGKAFLEAYGKVSKNVIEHNWYDHDTYSAMFYLEGNAQEQSTAYEDSNGYVEVTTGGKGYIYDPSTNSFSVRCYLGEEYQKTVDKSVELFVFQEMDYEEIVSVSLNESGDTLELVTEFDVADDLEYYQETYGIDSGRIHNVYQLDPETLRIRKLEVTWDKGDVSSPVCEVTVNTEASYVVPKELTAVMKPETTRTVTVVMDPGTSSEKTTEEIIASGTGISFMLPEGYQAYSDKACTQRYISDSTQGNITVYCKKS